MQINTAGIAIAKSKAMDLALAFSDDLRTVLMKNWNTSYSGTPLKPGSTMRLLTLRTAVTGQDVKMMRSNLVNGRV